MKFLELFKSIKRKEDQSDEPLRLAYANEGDVIALFRLLGLVAKADGKVTSAEINETQRFIDLFIPESFHELAKDSFREGRAANLVKGVITLNAFTLYWNRKTRWLEPLQVLDIMLKVAFADKSFSSWEEYIIDCTRQTLGIHKRTYWILRDRLAEQRGIEIKREGKSFAHAQGWSGLKRERQKPQDQSNTQEQKRESDSSQTTWSAGMDPYSVLGLEVDASEQEIKRAYRTLVKKYHPDKLRSGAGSEQDLKEAVARFCDIQEAYESVMQAHS